VRLKHDNNALSVEVADNGRGFGGPHGHNNRGTGLLGMQERVVSLGGTLRFERRPAGGARLVATIPNVGSEP
jgi:signal transduction histidine kinase